MRITLITIIAVLAAISCTAAAAPQSSLAHYKQGAVAFVEDLTIHGEDDDEAIVLYYPIDMCVDAEGNILVLDYKLQCIKKFDSKGRHVQTFAREGEGPGEIARAHRMTLTPEGNLLVFDSGNSRLTWFDERGDYVDARGFQGSVSHLEASKDGSIFVMVRYTYPGWIHKGRLYKVLRLSHDQETETPVDSAYVKDHQIAYEDDSSLQTVGAPFVARLMLAVLPSGNVVVGRGDEYTLKVLSPQLESIAEIRRDVAGIKVTDRHRERYYANYDDEPDLQAHVRKNVSFSRHLPYIKEIYVDDEGNILVETSLDGRSQDFAVYDVFTEDGIFVSQIEMPRFDPATVFRGGYVYMSRMPDDEPASIIRYRLEAPWGVGGE